LSYSRVARMAEHIQINKCNTTHKQNQEQNHIIISIDTENTVYKIQHPFMIKALKKLGIEGMYLNMIKVMYDKPIAYIILSGETLKLFLVMSGMR
jgi:hypothetical protein